MTRMVQVLYLIQQDLLCLVVMLALSACSSPSCSPSEQAELNEARQRCTAKAERFIQRYARNLRNTHRLWDTKKRCTLSERLLECFHDDALSNGTGCYAPDTEQMRKDREWAKWRKLANILDCSDQTRMKRVICFEDENKDYLMKQCDKDYKFNIKRHPEHSCVFFRQNNACKTALVTSACGDEGRILNKFVNIKAKHKKATKCRAAQEQTISSQQRDARNFHYSSACKIGEVNTVIQCYNAHVQPHLLKYLRDQNDFVLSSSEGVENACSEYNAYKECIVSTANSCPALIRHIYDHRSKIRINIHKLQKLCQNPQATNDYLAALPCYHRVLDRNVLQGCDAKWRQLASVLEQPATKVASPTSPTVTPHQFYCLPQYGNTILINRHLQEIYECYQNIFTQVCSTYNHTVFFSMFHLAFTDPFYLKLEYKPDCSLYPELYAPETVRPSGSSTAGGYAGGEGGGEGDGIDVYVYEDGVVLADKGGGGDTRGDTVPWRNREAEHPHHGTTSGGSEISGTGSRGRVVTLVLLLLLLLLIR